MLSFNQLLEHVNTAMAALDLNRQPDRLYAPIRYALSLGGKRLRPTLLLMAYNMYRDDTERVMPTALGIETFHNFTLLHDDVMDRADVRRGKPTVHKLWGDNTAILAGDNMLVMAFRMMQQADDAHLRQVMDIFSATAVEIDEGQQMDMDFETRMDVAEEEYIEMIRLKTSVLLAAALKIGAVQAGATAADTEALYDFGICLGLAFQLQDDLLDVYGDYATFGKKIGGDILCNKKTFMLINALARADKAQQQVLGQWLAATDYVAEEKIAAVTHIYDMLGIRELAAKRINAYFDKAVAALDAVSLPDERKAPLKELACALLQRRS